MSKVQLNPGEIKAFEYGCPLCGQQKGKKCIKDTGRLIPRPHLARVRHAQDLVAHKAKKHAPRQIGHGDVTNVGLSEHEVVPEVFTNDFEPELSYNPFPLTETHEFLSTM